MILQQPSETHLRLDATTDKTAISSFVIATVIALALAGLATWLAYWYGRKSFDLTKQSFDALIKQIESSEQVTMASNIGFAQSQADNKLMELRFLYKSSEIENMRKMISDYFTTVISLNSYMVFKVGRLTDHNFIDKDAKEKYINELFEEIKKYANEIFIFSFQLDLMSDMENSPEKKIIGEELKELNYALNEIIGNLANDKQTIIDSIIKFSFKFDEVKQNLTRYFLNEVELHKGE